MKNLKDKLKRYFILLSDSSFKQYIRFILRERIVTNVIGMLNSINNRRQRIVPKKWKDHVIEVNHICVEKFLERSNIRFSHTLPLSKCHGDFRTGNCIKFASIMYNLEHDIIDWEKDFGDNESNMYLHRFGWVLHTLAHSKRVPWDYIFSWVTWRNNTSAHSYEYDPYTVSERLCNLSIILMLDSPTSSEIFKIKKIIIEDAIYLSNNLEYYGHNYTNNHILNNARALIISGSLLEVGQIYALGIDILKNQIEVHVSEDGVLREGSSHYQLIVTRWMIEILLVLKYKGDKYFSEFKIKVDHMVNVCKAMTAGNNNIYTPLIGDVSPDFPPKWFFGITNSYNLLLSDTKLKEVYKYTGCDHWIGLFGIDAKKIEGSSLDGSWISKDNEWANLKTFPWSVLCHSDVRIKDVRVNHGHSDAFSFDLSYNGSPIIVDPGRKNYHSFLNSKESSVIEKYHNTILVNSKGLGFLPRSFMDSCIVSKNISRVNLECLEDRIHAFINTPKTLKNVDRIDRTILSIDGLIKVYTNVETIKKSKVTLHLNVYSSFIRIVSNNRIEFDMTNNSTFYILFQGIKFKEMRSFAYYKEYGEEKEITRLTWESDYILNFTSIFSIGRKYSHKSLG